MVENVTCSRERVFCGTPCGKFVFLVPTPLVLFLRYFPGSSSAGSIDATGCATLMTAGRVRILAESHGSCGKSTAGFLADHPLITIAAAIPPFTLVRICATLQAPVRRLNLALQR